MCCCWPATSSFSAGCCWLAAALLPSLLAGLLVFELVNMLTPNCNG
jgi:hypothetical protein